MVTIGLVLACGLQWARAANVASHRIPLAVRADGLRLNGGVVAVSRGTEVFLPVRELALTLEFPVRLDIERARAEGWFLDPSRRYVIDARSARVRSEGDAHALNPSAFLLDRLDTRRELYVKASVLEQAWPVSLTVSHSDLALEVEAAEPLPIQQRRAREERRKRLASRSRFQPPDLPRLAHPYGWVRPPVVGFDIDARIRSGPNAVRQRLRWSQEIAGLNVAAGVSAAGPTFSRTEVRDAHLTFQRFADASPLMGGLERVAVGDVSGESLAHIGSVGNGRGITLSSFPLNRATTYDLYRLEGEAPAGWDAELYRDGQLVDFQQVRDDGRYRFDGVQLHFGLNRLHVILYGPQGQTRERYETVDVGQTQAPQGETYWRVDRVQAGRDFVPVEDEPQPGAGNEGIAGTSARVVHGLNRRLSLEAGSIELPADSGRPARRYALVGAAGALGPTATRLRILGQADGGIGLDVRSRIRGARIPLRLGLAVFEDFESPRVGFGGSALRGEFDLALRAPLTLGPARVWLGARYGYSETVSGRQRHDVNLSQRWNVGGISWNHDVHYRVSDEGVGQWSAHLDASDRFLLGRGGNLRWGAGLAYAQEVGVTGVRLRTRYRPWSATTIGLNLRHATGAAHTAVAMDLSQEWDNARLSLVAYWSEDTADAFGLRYSIGFGPTGNGGYTLAKPHAPRRGSVAVHAFVDRDGDGAYDAGELPVPEAKLKNPLNRGEATDASGRLVMHDLEAHQTYPVQLDSASLMNPFWMPASEGREVTVRPGAVPVVELPVEATGSISGTVKLEASGSAVPNVPLRLIDQSGETVAQARSVFGGFYSFEHVPYGSYELRLDNAHGYALAQTSEVVELTSRAPMQSGMDVIVITRSTLEGERLAGANEGSTLPAEPTALSESSDAGRQHRRRVAVDLDARARSTTFPRATNRQRDEVIRSMRTDKRGAY